MSLPSNMPNLNALPEDVIDEILRGGEFKINIELNLILKDQLILSQWTFKIKFQINITS